MTEIKTWNHVRKGPITGFVVWEDDTWVDIQLVGDQKLSLASRFADPYYEDGEVLRSRKSLITEVTTDG